MSGHVIMPPEMLQTQAVPQKDSTSIVDPKEDDADPINPPSSQPTRAEHHKRKISSVIVVDDDDDYIFSESVSPSELPSATTNTNISGNGNRLKSLKNMITLKHMNPEERARLLTEIESKIYRKLPSHSPSPSPPPSLDQVSPERPPTSEVSALPLLVPSPSSSSASNSAAPDSATLVDSSPPLFTEPEHPLLETSPHSDGSLANPPTMSSEPAPDINEQPLSRSSSSSTGEPGAVEDIPASVKSYFDNHFLDLPVGSGFYAVSKEFRQLLTLQALRQISLAAKPASLTHVFVLDFADPRMVALRKEATDRLAATRSKRFAAKVKELLVVLRERFPYSGPYAAHTEISTLTKEKNNLVLSVGDMKKLSHDELSIMFKVLCEDAGIECRAVRGKNPQNKDCAWNFVREDPYARWNLVSVVNASMVPTNSMEAAEYTKEGGVSNAIPPDGPFPPKIPVSVPATLAPSSSTHTPARTPVVSPPSSATSNPISSPPVVTLISSPTSAEPPKANPLKLRLVLKSSEGTQIETKLDVLPAPKRTPQPRLQKRTSFNLPPGSLVNGDRGEDYEEGSSYDATPDADSEFSSRHPSDGEEADDDSAGEGESFVEDDDDGLWGGGKGAITQRTPSNQSDKSTRRGRPAQPNSKRSQKPKPDPHAPLRPISCYHHFCKEVREDLLKTRTDVSYPVIGQIAGDRWKKLPDADRAVYIKRANDQKQNYEKEMAVYKKTENYKTYQKYLEEFYAQRPPRAVTRKRTYSDVNQPGGATAQSASPSAQETPKRQRSSSIITRKASSAGIDSPVTPRKDSTPGAISRRRTSSVYDIDDFLPSISTPAFITPIKVKEVFVPSWKEVERRRAKEEEEAEDEKESTIETLDDDEDTSDEGYLKRHEKFDHAEKNRLPLPIERKFSVNLPPLPQPSSMKKRSRYNSRDSPQKQQHASRITLEHSHGASLNSLSRELDQPESLTSFENIVTQDMTADQQPTSRSSSPMEVNASRAEVME